MGDLLHRIIWGNSVLSYIIAAGSILAAWVILKLIKNWLITFLKKIASRTSSDLDDIIVAITEKFIVSYLYLFINYNIISQLNFSAKTARILDAAMMVITTYYLIRSVNYVFHHLVIMYMNKKNEPSHRIMQADGMVMVAKALVWAIGIIMLADNLGYDVTTIIAGLGVGGIAIALAAQSILGDLFSYIVIFFDKPFEIGDFIVMGTSVGIVEKIGIKTSHIRSLDGHQLIMPNAEMVKSVIQNFKRLQRRRVVFGIGVVYYTKSAKLRNIPNIIKDIILVQPQTDFDRTHLKSFGDFSINYEIVYYINSSEYQVYMDIHQEICMRIFEAFEEQQIEFAFPTQTLFVSNNDDPKKTPPAFAPASRLQ